MTIRLEHFSTFVRDVGPWLLVAIWAMIVLVTVRPPVRRSRWFSVAILIIGYAFLESIECLALQFRLGMTFARVAFADLVVTVIICSQIAWALINESRGGYWAALLLSVLNGLFWGLMMAVATQYGTYHDQPCSISDYVLIILRCVICALVVYQLVRGKRSQSVTRMGANI